jgi:1,4-dihydroxy-2-naphthoyl-CoA hydrolase
MTPSEPWRSSPFDAYLGIEFELVQEDRARARVHIDPQRHHQPRGIVHGGLYSTLIETVASFGTSQSPKRQGRDLAAVEVHTSLLRQVAAGTLTAEGWAVHPGSRLQLWQVEVRDDQGRLVAHGSCRLLFLDRPV